MKLRRYFASGAITIVAACGEAPAVELSRGLSEPDTRRIELVRDTILPGVVEAPATTEPFREAMLSTKLMSRVVEVPVHEGDRVRQGEVLVRLDDRELTARREQAHAGLRAAEAALAEAVLHAERIRALHADSAAPRAQLDGAEASLARAEQAVRGGHAVAAEVESLADYAVVRAPFSGTVVGRFVDPGVLAAPGAPLVKIEDASRLRLSAPVAPTTATRTRRGMTVGATIEGTPASGRVEGVIPAGNASLVSVQVIVDNADGRYSSGSSATVSIPGAPKAAILVPATAIVRSGDLTGVRTTSPGGIVTRWVRLGLRHGEFIEVLSGLVPGDSIVTAGF